MAEEQWSAWDFFPTAVFRVPRSSSSNQHVNLEGAAEAYVVFSTWRSWHRVPGAALQGPPGPPF